MMSKLLTVSLIARLLALDCLESSFVGTSSIDGISGKQLAIQRWFAQLSYLQNMSSWDGWGDALDDLDCDGNTCIRYEIAGLAYAAAVVAYKTPSYTQVSEAILYNAIQRMIKKEVYQYIELFDDFTSQSTYPDPVAYKNIMYSGHLAQVLIYGYSIAIHFIHLCCNLASLLLQMIMLFESISGNTTFSDEGWAFDWGADSAYPQPITYTTRQLMQAVYNQTGLYEGARGGVPCEPDSIFVICNNYPMNAFLLHDALYNTTYTTTAAADWQNTVEEHGVNKLPDVEGADNNFFNLDFLIHPLGIWEPIGE